MKVCTNCRQKQALEAFPPDARRRDGHGSWCHRCHQVAVAASLYRQHSVNPEFWRMVEASRVRDENRQTKRILKRIAA